jgi:murein DD-endopeptidase MepM/ murein hydrolase activator NlpD
MKVFPVSNGASYSSDYNTDPSRGRTHLGNDLFGQEGTPLLAVDDGDVRFGEDGLGGHVANLRSPDGTRYYYAHLSAFEGSNRRVKAGDVIGYMGHTGNAQGTPNHLHFEIHPGGGAAIDPHAQLRAAPIAGAGSASGPKSVLWPLAFLVAVGLGTWAFADNRSFQRVVGRRLGF